MQNKEVQGKKSKDGRKQIYVNECFKNMLKRKLTANSEKTE